MQKGSNKLFTMPVLKAHFHTCDMVNGPRDCLGLCRWVLPCTERRGGLRHPARLTWCFGNMANKSNSIETSCSKMGLKYELEMTNKGLIMWNLQRQRDTHKIPVLKKPHWALCLKGHLTSSRWAHQRLKWIIWVTNVLVAKARNWTKRKHECGSQAAVIRGWGTIVIDLSVHSYLLVTEKCFARPEPQRTGVIYRHKGRQLHLTEVQCS